MAVLLGGSVGSLVAMLVVCFLVYKFGPKRLAVNFALQVAISGLITLYLATDHYGVHQRPMDVMATWLGWVVALAIMLIVVLRKARSKRSVLAGSIQD